MRKCSRRKYIVEENINREYIYRSNRENIITYHCSIGNINYITQIKRHIK